MANRYINLSKVIDAANANLYAPQRKTGGIIPTVRFSSESIPLATELGVANSLAEAIGSNKGHFKRQKSNGDTIISPLKIIADPEVADTYYLGQGGSIVNAGKLAINADGPRGEKAKSIADVNLDEKLAALKYATVNVSGKQVHHMNEIDSTARYASQLDNRTRGHYLSATPHFGFFQADDRRNQTALWGNTITGPKDPRGERFIPSRVTDEHQAGVHRIYDVLAAEKGMPNTNKKTSIEEAMGNLPTNTQKEALAWSHLYLSRLALQGQKIRDIDRLAETGQNKLGNVRAYENTERLLDMELLNTKPQEPYDALGTRFAGSKSLREVLEPIKSTAEDRTIRKDRNTRVDANEKIISSADVVRRRMQHRDEERRDKIEREYKLKNGYV